MASTTHPFVRPDVQAYLDTLLVKPYPPMSSDFIAMIRHTPPGTLPFADLPAGEIAVQQTVTINGPGGPLDLTLCDCRETREPGQVAVYFHGGGFVIGGEETHGSLAVEIARSLDVPLVFVHYRLAPENPFPAAPDDCEAATRWIASAAGAEALGRIATGLIIVGDSAGGNLALVTAMALRDVSADSPVDLVWSIYPNTDMDGEARDLYESGRLYGKGFGLSIADGGFIRASYAPPQGHWRASPLMGETAGLPQVLLVTTDLDPLRDQVRAWAAKAVGSGVSLTFIEYAGTIHGFAAHRACIPSASVDLADMTAVARGLLGRRPGGRAP
jgi:acetyl esterase